MLEFKENQGTLTCIFKGKMDSQESMAAQPRVLGRASQNIKNVVFDMTDVDYVASAFLQICILVAKQVGAPQLKLINAKPEIRKIFKITGFDTILGD